LAESWLRSCLLVGSFLEFIEASSSFIRRGSPLGEANGSDG
jgi:hypothetical protein